MKKAAVSIVFASALTASPALACSCAEGPLTERDLAGRIVLDLDIQSRTWASMLCGISRSTEERTAKVRSVLHGAAPPTGEIIIVNELSPAPGFCYAQSSACQFKLASGRAQMVLTSQADGTYKTGGICMQMAWAARNEGSR